MFRESVMATRLTTEFANRYFLNITGDSFRGDTTFTATLRALFGSRVPVSERILLTVGESGFSNKRISETKPAELVWYLTRQMNPDPGGFYIHNLTGAEDDNMTCINILRNNFAGVFDGWHEIDKVFKFYEKSFNVVCFVNPQTKNVAVFVDRLNLQKWHYLQIAAAAMLPWYFDSKSKMGCDELALIQTMRERKPDAYLSQIEVIAKKYDK